MSKLPNSARKVAARAAHNNLSRTAAIAVASADVRRHLNVTTRRPPEFAPGECWDTGTQACAWCAGRRWRGCVKHEDGCPRK